MASRMRRVPMPSDVGGVFGLFKADTATWLCARQVVDLVRLDLLDDAHQVAGVGQVAVVQVEVGVVDVRVLVEVVDRAGC